MPRKRPAHRVSAVSFAVSFAVSLAVPFAVSLLRLVWKRSAPADRRRQDFGNAADRRRTGVAGVWKRSRPRERVCGLVLLALGCWPVLRRLRWLAVTAFRHIVAGVAGAVVWLAVARVRPVPPVVVVFVLVPPCSAWRSAGTPSPPSGASLFSGAARRPQSLRACAPSPQPPPPCVPCRRARGKPAANCPRLRRQRA